MGSINEASCDFQDLFGPCSVAHIGASPKMVPGRFTFLEYMQQMGFQGELYPVNPNYKEIKGLTCYPDTASIPGVVDVAILALPAAHSIEVLRSVPTGKIKYVVVHTSGFSEIDKPHLEDEILALARQKGFRIIGPNCMGIFSQQSKIGFWEDHKELAARPGSVGFVSQSGGLGINVISRGIDLGIGIDKALSLGNQIDIKISEVIDYFGRDDSIRVIGAYVEDVKDGREFLETLKRVTPKKPVLIWKGGVTEVGKAAAKTHTGSMAGNEQIFANAMRQVGAIYIDNIEQMLVAMKILQQPGRLPGKNLAIICPGGGNVVNISDAFGAQPNISLPPTTPECRARLQKLVPEENVDLKNPVDPGAVGIIEMGKILKILADEPYIDSIITLGSADFFSILPNDQVREFAREAMVSTIVTGADAGGKPSYFLAMQIRDNVETCGYRKMLESKLEEKGVPCLNGSYSQIATVFSRLAWYQDFLESL